jgi:hypothetical protein
VGEVIERMFASGAANAYREYGIWGAISVVLVFLAFVLVLALLKAVWMYRLVIKDLISNVYRLMVDLAKTETFHSGVCAIVLFIAAFTEWPYFMYVLLRVFICGSSAYITSKLYSRHRVPLTWLFGAIAVLFNPVLPVRMARSDWQATNVLAAIIFIAFSVYLNWDSLLRRQSRRTVADYLREDLKRESWIELTAADYLTDELSKKAFFAFTRESPAMKLAFHNGWGQTLSPERPLTRGRLTIIFNDVGIQLARTGDSEGSDRSFACSSLFIKGNPLTWAALAEVALAKEDRMAATWAQRVIKFRLQKSASPELREFLSTDEAKVLLRAARERMREIVDVCKTCTSWHDSTEVINEMGVSESYFDR